MFKQTGNTRSLAHTLLSRVTPSRGRKVYLLDFAAYKPDEEELTTGEELLAWAVESELFTTQALLELTKIYLDEHWGVGDRTALPTNLKQLPPDDSYSACVRESHKIMFDTAEKAMAAAGIKPRQVDVLITVSGFCTMPTLSTAVAAKFGMRSDLDAYHLGGHGCAASTMSIFLARQLLLAGHTGRIALILLHENVTNGFYRGSEEEFLRSNVLFRLGGAGVVLSSRSQDKKRAKYTLKHAIRSMYATPEGHSALCMRQDGEGHKGVFLDHVGTKNTAAKTIAIALRSLGPHVLPWSQMMKVARNPKHSPDFTGAFQHICVHPGARMIIDKVSEALNFGQKSRLPSIAMLERYGNTGCSSVFYILAQMESTHGVKAGEKVLQLAMGHGFKAAACVWKARKTITTEHAAWGPTAPYKQRPKLEAGRVAGELLAAKDLTPAARAQTNEYLAAVSRMEHDKATVKARAAEKARAAAAGEAKPAAGEAKSAAGVAPADAPAAAAPAPPASALAQAIGMPAAAPGGKGQAPGAKVAVLCTEPGMPVLPPTVGVA